MSFSDIIVAIKEIGLVPVLVILLLLFQFRTIIRLEKMNDMLIDKLFKKKGEKDDKINSRDNISRDSNLSDVED